VQRRPFEFTGDLLLIELAFDDKRHVIAEERLRASLSGSASSVI